MSEIVSIKIGEKDYPVGEVHQMMDAELLDARTVGDIKRTFKKYKKLGLEVDFEEYMKTKNN